MKTTIKWGFILSAYLCIAGCAGVITKETQYEVDPTLSFQMVFKNPEAHKGEVVIWGGTIISTRNLKEGTLVEVLQKPLRFGKAPAEGDASEGRFLALYDGYLDTAIYAKDREITLAGTVLGRRTQPLDEIEYAYPLIRVKELHLWDERSKDSPDYYPHPFHYPYRPWWYFRHW